MTVYTETSDYASSPHLTDTLQAGDSFIGSLVPKGPYESDNDWVPVYLDERYSYIVEFLNEFDRPVLDVVDASGNEISSGSSSVSGNTFVWMTAPSTGTYYISVWDRYVGNGSYKINVYSEVANTANTTETITFDYGNELAGQYTGTHNYIEDRDWISGYFEAGRTYVITLNNNVSSGGTFFGVLDSSGNYIEPDNSVYSESLTKVAFTPQTSGTYFLYEKLYFGSGSHNPVPVTGSDIYTIDVRHEAAANADTKYSISAGEVIVGNFDYLGDVDWYRTELSAGVSYVLSVPSGSMELVRIVDAAGNAVDSTSPESYSRTHHVVTPPASGTYYVWAKGYSGAHQLALTAEIAGDISTATETMLGQTLDSSFDFSADRDVIALDVVVGLEYTVTADLEGASSRRISIDILDDSGNRVIARTGSSVDTQSRDFVATYTGQVFIELDESSGSGDRIDYTLRVLPKAVETILGTLADDTLTGTDANETLQGKEGNDAISAGGGDDIIDGDEGNDILNGGAGDDSVSGGSGFDICQFAGSRAQVVVTRQSDTVVKVDASASGEGTDTLQDIERIQLADGTIALDLTGAAGQTYRLYQAAFDRTPDDVGLSHNVHLMDGGLGIFDMAAAFIASEEFQLTYGSGISNTAFITLLYQNVLDRGPDDAGLAGWLDAMSGGQSHAQVLFGFSESAENKANVAAAIDDGIWLV